MRPVHPGVTKGCALLNSNSQWVKPMSPSLSRSVVGLFAEHRFELTYLGDGNRQLNRGRLPPALWRGRSNRQR